MATITELQDRRDRLTKYDRMAIVSLVLVIAANKLQKLTIRKSRKSANIARDDHTKYQS